MDEVKGKFKDFMKKMNKPFSASSPKFKGEGRVLGSSSSTPSPIPSAPHRNSQPTNPKFIPNSKESLGEKPSDSESQPRNAQVAGSNRGRGEFDPFDTHISSRTDTPSGTTSLNMFQCPLCNEWFKSEQQVSAHVDECLENKTQHAKIDPALDETLQGKDELSNRVATFLSGKPSEKTLEVILRLLRNVVSDPANEKFRRIRMSNPKIQETVGSAVGGVELLECVGFRFDKEGEGEAEDTWGIMEMPSVQGISLISEAIVLLDPSSVSSATKQDYLPPRTIDRQVRVFFAAPDNMAAKIELPDSFFELSPAELKREAESRKKKIEDSQLLIPKSFREKQAKAVRKRYKATVIRIQFPDRIILQGVFLPLEPTSALYEFARSALKEKCLDFELLGPAVPKSSVIPCSAKTGKNMATLQDEGLVPAVLIKFRPIETDSVVFTGLRNELLAVSEPLTPAAFPRDVEFKLVYQGT